MPTAYAYIRYSSKAQGGADKDSVDRQMSSIEAVTKRHNIELLSQNIFSDTGVSGYDGSNSRTGKLKELIDRINNLEIKKGDYVFVESIDRLSRQRLLQAKELVNNILEKGIVLITTIDGQRYEKPNDTNGIDDLQQDILLSVISKRAHEESRTKSIRRKSAWNRAKASAETDQTIFNAHNPPYGIHYDKKTNSFIINEDEAKEIRQIFESLKYVGVSQTIRDINATSKRKWSNKNISLLFSTKYPLGYYMAQRRDEQRRKIFESYIENYYPQIISFELWQEVRNAMEGRKRRKNYGSHSLGNLNIVRHSVKCGQCKATLLFEMNKNPKGIQYSYFHCYTQKEIKGKCEQPRFRFEYALGILLEFVKNATEKPNYIGAGIIDADYIDQLDPDVWEERHNTFKELLAYLMNDKGGAITTQKQLSIFEAELSKNVIIEQNLNKSFETFDDGVIPELFIKRVVSVQNTIQQLRAEITKLKASLNTNKTDLRIYSTDDILRLYETEQGRLELNNFFVVNEISFVFDYIKETRTLIGKVLHKGHFIQWVEKKFPLHNPLVKEYGIQNINKIAETSNGFQYSKD